MRLEYQIAVALLLDLAFGKPRWLPDTGRLIGRLISTLEGSALRIIPDTRLAGAVTALFVIIATALATFAIIGLARLVHPFLGNIISIFVLYGTIGARDLADHSNEVYQSLEKFDLTEARRLVSWLVGRDTERLTETEVVRATVESVSENTLSGVVAPIFFAALGGPVIAMAYKATGAIDSMVGFWNERNIDFGRMATKVNIFANWLPARFAAVAVAAAAALLKFRAASVLKICLRDGLKHENPHVGIVQAAFSGALGIRLGGVLEKRGRPLNLPEIGDPVVPLARAHIVAAIRIMYAVTGIAAVALLAARWGIATILTAW